MIKLQAYRRPLLERPLLKTYMISLVWFIFNPPFWQILTRMYLSIGAVDVKLTEEEKKELEEPYMAQAIFVHS